MKELNYQKNWRPNMASQRYDEMDGKRKIARD